MSIRFKIPLIMLFAFILNIVILMTYYKVYLSNRVEIYQNNMDKAVSETAQQISSEIDGKSFDFATNYLTSFENPHYFTLSLKNIQTGKTTAWYQNNSHHLGFSEAETVTLSSQIYIFQVQKHVELFNLTSHSVFNNLLFFEFAVLFGMFLLVGVVIHFIYVTALLKLDSKMKRFKSGEVITATTGRRDEISQLNKSFSKLSMTLYEEKQLQNRIIASISHDIKTPLTSVLGYSERITKKVLTTEKQKQYINTIYNQAKDIEAIVNEFDDYLSASLPDKGEQRNYFVNYLCKMLQEEYSTQLTEQNILFLVENKCENHRAIYVDIFKFRRVFSNIITNSIRHAKVKDVKISLIAESSQRHIFFTLADNGGGVNDSDLPHIFEPFYTSDKSRRVSGLGLSICKQIIEGQDGTITAFNNDQGGLSAQLSFTGIELSYENK